MCQNCGCSVVGEINIHSHHPQEHSHEHPQEYSHEHPQESSHHHPHEHYHEHHNHEYSHAHHNRDRNGKPVRSEDFTLHTGDIQEIDNGHKTVTIAQKILDKNDRLAERNRGYFAAKGLLVLNVVSSPGSGKTAFLEKTISDLKERIKAGVIVGDLETDNDAHRLSHAGAPAVQIVTGTVCHLEAQMVARAAGQLDLDALELLIIENVGNLVCPAAYDLGEDLRIVLLSVTEGEDKPLKYPTMFKSADAVVVNKIDIAEAVGFDREKALANIKRVAPEATLFEVSARTGAGMEAWYKYLDLQMLGRDCLFELA